jgi:predicted O-methyltransferase YrrM
MENNSVDTSGSCRSKLLSICMMGRDDDYSHDFKYRITTTNNYIARNLKQIGRLDDVEVLVTDWGSQVPLAQTLLLSSEAAQICRFVYVPPGVVRAVQDGMDKFHMSLAANAGLRRARGRYIMMSPADTLIPQHSLESVLNVLDGKLHLSTSIDQTYFLCRRYQVPWQFVQRQPDLDEWDRYLLLNPGELEQGGRWVYFNVSSGAGAIMMHRSLWHKVHGCDERFGGWGFSDIDLGLRVTQYHLWMDLSNMGVSLFHLEHFPSGRRASMISQNQNPHVYNQKFAVNDDNWGLGNCELEIQMPQKICAAREPAESLRLPLGSKSQKVASWEQSSSDVLAELTSEEVRNHVMRIITSQSIGHIDQKDMDSLFFLAWYSWRHYPRRYLEFGIGQGCAPVVVAAGCPSVEIYGIDRWAGVMQHQTPIHVADTLRRLAEHHAYVRFINGDIGTAVQRLKDSFLGSFSFDLVLVRSDLFEADAVKQVANLLPYLATGGALVLIGKSADCFAPVWNEIRRQFPRFTYLQCKSAKTGLILAATLKNDGLGVSADSESDVRVNFGRLPRLYLASQFIRRGYRAIRNPTKYPEYAKRICRFLLSR